MNKKLVLIILTFAFLLRLLSLSQSLWLDEAITAQVVKNYSFREIITKFSPFDFHPPLYYLFMKLWTSIFGYSEIALRFPSILFSLATGYIILHYLSQSSGHKDMRSHIITSAIWASALFLFNPLIIYYSQEARMYSMATSFLTFSFVRFLKKKHLDFPSLFAFTLALFTFYGSIFFITSIFLYLIFKRKTKEALKLIVITTISSLILLPLLKTQLQNSKILLETVKNWSLVLGKANIKNLLLVPIKFSVGRISFYPKWLYYAIAGVWTVFVFSSFKNYNKNFKTKLSSFVFATSLALIFFASFVKPMLQYFRVLYLITPLSIILAESSEVKKRLILTGFVIFSLIYLLIPAFHREDWKSLVKDLRGGERVYIIPQVKAPLEYYAEKFGKEIEIRPLQETLQNPRLTKNSIIIPYAAEIFGISFSSQKYQVLKTYRGIQIIIPTLSPSSNTQ